jgi:hypothetical protein
MAEVTARLRASRVSPQNRSADIRHARNHLSSKKALVSVPWLAQFLRGYVKGYDRDHWDLL